MSTLLSIEGLGLQLPGPDGPVPILRDVGFTVARGESVALVGESGSGKSMTARSIVRSLPKGATVTGHIGFDGVDVNAMTAEQLRCHREEHVGLVHQDARACINPVRRIGDFLTEGLRLGRGMGADEARRRVLGLMEDLYISEPERRLKQYPHQLSGGLLQRMLIVAALATEPQLIIADEPTTALDVTTQAEVMAILDEQRRERGLALLFITHDLDLATAVCDRVGVMYAGSIVEKQATEGLHEHPRHPYTRGLLDARPSVEHDGHRLHAIRGRPVSLVDAEAGCTFAPRCEYVQDRCRVALPPLEPVGPAEVRCVRADELAAVLAARPVEEAS